MNFNLCAGSLIALTALSGCGDREVKLTGERFEVTSPLSASAGTESVHGQGGVDRPAPGADMRGAAGSATGGAAPIALPAQQNVAAWTHQNGSVRHRVQHPAFGTQPRLIWAGEVGQGNDRRHRITADPVVADGRIIAMDSRARVTAHSTSGAALWTRDLTPPSDRTDDASGGGLAYGGGKVFVTTAFGALVALDARTGAEVWRQRIGAAVTGTPTVEDGIVYVVSRDGVAWAIEAANGRIRWQLPSVEAALVRVGGAGPAINGNNVIFPFGTGEMVATLKKGGMRLWSARVAGFRKGRAYPNIADISADPVVDGNVIYAGNPSGRVVALEASGGTTLWTAKEGAVSPVWPAGNAVFLVSDQSELVRLDAATGNRVWSTPMPWFTKEKVRKRLATYAHFGPVLAGGRLWVASGDGQLRAFDPASGQLTGATELPGGAASNPVVVNRTMYVVSQSGQLLAFR